MKQSIITKPICALSIIALFFTTIEALKPTEKVKFNKKTAFPVSVEKVDTIIENYLPPLKTKVFKVKNGVDSYGNEAYIAFLLLSGNQIKHYNKEVRKFKGDDSKFESQIIAEIDEELLLWSYISNIRYKFGKRLAFFPYMVTSTSMNIQNSYVTYSYKSLVGHLSPYINCTSKAECYTQFKKLGEVPSQQIWKLFIVNQLMISIKLFSKVGYMHYDIRKSSVALKSKFEAGWHDIDSIYVPINAKFEVIRNVYRNKFARKSVHPTYDTKKTQEFMNHSKRWEMYWNQIKLPDGLDIRKSVTPFALLMIQIFDPFFKLSNNPTEAPDFVKDFKDSCILSENKDKLHCTVFKDLIINMLRVEYYEPHIFNDYHKRFSLGLMNVLNQSLNVKFQLDQKYGNPILINDEIKEDFKSQYEKMLVLRVKDKYELCTKDPGTICPYFKKRFIADYEEFNSPLPSRGKELKVNLKNFLKDFNSFMNDMIGFAIEAAVVNNTYEKIDFKDFHAKELCMYAFFELEANLFDYHYLTDPESLNRIIRAAIPEDKMPDKDLSSWIAIWMKAMKRGIESIKEANEIIFI